MKSQRPKEAILIRNTMTFDRASAEAFKHAIRDAVQFAEKHAPQQMIQVFIDEKQGLCYSFQLYDDSEAVLRHWDVSDPHIAAVMQHGTVERIEVYGSPSDAVREAILASVGSDRVTFVPGFIGFSRLVG